jgi:hypothetical protein
MGFLRRLLGGGERPAAASDSDEATEAAETADEAEAAAGPVDLDAAERAHELEMLRAEQERLDELTQRQLRYEKYAWQPPAQGGERRAEDNDAERR